MKKIKLRRLEIAIADHCNLKCNLCDHSSGLLPKGFTHCSKIINELKMISKVLVVDELVVAGGEPLLNNEIISILKEVKKIEGIGENITLITNGLLLHNSPEEIWGLIDGIWISTYPSVKKISFDDIGLLAQKYNVWVFKKETNSFKRTIVDQLNDNEAITDFAYKTCLRAHTFSCHLLKDGVFYKCTPAVFTKKRLDLKGIKYSADFDSDGISVFDDVDILYHNLRNYLNSSRPLESCKYCLGELGNEYGHVQVENRKDLLKIDYTRNKEYYNSLFSEKLEEISFKKPKNLRLLGDALHWFLHLNRRFNSGFRGFENVKKKNIGKIFELPPATKSSFFKFKPTAKRDDPITKIIDFSLNNKTIVVIFCSVRKLFSLIGLKIPNY
jgi:organic radical activating enzyme